MPPLYRVLCVLAILLAAVAFTVYAATLSHAAAPCCPGGVCLPPPPPVPSLVVVKGLKRRDPAPTPADLTAAIAACESDKNAVASAQANIVTAQAALATAQKQIDAAQAASDAGQVKLSTDATALMALLAKLYPIGPIPTPVPVPTPSGVVSLLEVSTTTCSACNAMNATVATLKGLGYAVSRVDCDVDPTAQDKWKPALYPTWVMQVDGSEVTRTTGTMTSDDMQSWLDATITWAKTLSPGSKP